MVNPVTGRPNHVNTEDTVMPDPRPDRALELPSRVTRRAALGTGLGLGLAVATGQAVGPVSAAPKPPPPRHIAFRKWTSGGFTGTGAGTAAGAEGVVLTTPLGTRSYTDPFGGGERSYDFGTWTTPWVDPGFDYTELVASWDAVTPDGTWIEVEVRGVGDDRVRSGWYVLGRWTRDDPDDGGAIHRTSLGGQGTDLATVAIDTLVARKDRSLRNWQLRLTLLRPAGGSTTPRVRLLGAMASALPADKKVPTSPPGLAEGRTLDVPTYSQEVHIGHYPEWDNGGEAWCSPTSTAMVLSYWAAGPTAQDTSWVQPPVDAVVDYAARNVFDYNYDGAGNWPFNTAYAGRYGLESFVTRLRSLAEAELFIAAGIPLVASVSFKKSQLDGAGYGTNGHLMVIVGFTDSGDVVVNDPASHLIPDNSQVRVVYDRGQFENAWVPHSGGIVYVIHPASVALPRRPREANW